MKYLLVDTSNLYFRARFMAGKHATTEDKLGWSIHTAMGSMGKPWREQKADHVVFAFEGRSWRKDFYAPYKADRAVKHAAMTEAEKEENRLFYETYDEMISYLKEKTNCTCLQHIHLEADDLIAGWIAAHPDDQHCIVSSDSDFHQLLSENVTQYNGITDETITIDGVFNYKGAPVIDKKTKEPKHLGDPKYILFEKITRGDPTDNVFSAYPGVRTKGSKNKVGLLEAFLDRDVKGYNYNNFMLQRWTDHNGVEHRVIDDFARNETLIDLTAQPPEIKKLINDTISAASINKNVPLVGAHFLKFCGKHDLVKLSERSDFFAKLLSASYCE